MKVLALAAAVGALCCAPALADTVAYQVDPAHDGWQPGGAVTLPASRAWADTFGTPPSYPLIANGVAYVVAGPTSGSALALFALDAGTGAALWQHSLTSSAGLAYDAGRVFVVDGGGLLTAFDAASGNIDWSSQLPGQYAFSAPPTAAGGIVYVGGAGSGGTLYAVNEASGALVWSQPVQNGDTSSPAVDAANVYVTYPGQYYAFNRSTGAPVWYDNGSIEGGGGWTPTVADGHLFVRDTNTSPKILSSASGAVQGPLGGATAAPAIANGIAYELGGSTLNAVADDGLGSTAWSFAGDGQLDTAPLVVGGTVWVGSSTGALYALDGASGHQLWSTNAGAAIDGPNEYSGPLRGMAAGDGLLLVPAGSSLIAYGSYAPGASSGTGPTPSPTTGSGAAPTSTAKASPAAQLGSEIVLRHLSVHAFLAHRAVRVRVKAPSAGRVAIRWFFLPAHGPRRLVASGAQRFTRAGMRWVTLRRSASARRWLGRARHGAAMLASAQFTPTRGHRVSVAARFRLRA